MYITDILEKNKESRIKIFVDMDGVIADYDVGFPYDYDKKRPLFSNIAVLEEISKMENVEIYVLSASRLHIGIDQKNEWLDKYAPFFKKENRIIIAREDNNYELSKSLKERYIYNLERDDSKIIVIDDDPAVLKEIAENHTDIILLKDTALVK